MNQNDKNILDDLKALMFITASKQIIVKNIKYSKNDISHN